MTNEIDALLKKLPAPARRSAHALRKLVKRHLPDALERVRKSDRAITYTMDGNPQGSICGIGPLKSSVALTFENGADLRDPESLLEGSAGAARRVTIGTPKDAANPALKRLLAEAFALKEIDTIFAELKNLLKPYASRLEVVTDEPTSYYLDTRVSGPNGQPVFFAAVQPRADIVSFHLMPVYCFPELLQGMSRKLKGRMHGKSCFNFKKRDPKLFKELAGLVADAFERYEDENLA